MNFNTVGRMGSGNTKHSSKSHQKEKQRTEGVELAKSKPVVSNPGPVDENRQRVLSKYTKQTEKSTNVAALTKLAYNVERVALKAERIEELILPETTTAVKSITSVYTTKSKSFRLLLANLAVDLALPRLTYDIVKLVKEKCPDFTRWDREKKKKEELSETEGKEPGKENATERLVDIEDAQADEAMKRAQVVVSDLMCSNLNFSDACDEFCLSCGEVGLIPLFLQMVEELKDCIPDMIPFVDKTRQVVKKFTVRGKLLSRVMGILHNLAKRVPNRTLFTSCSAIDILLPLLKAEVTLYATKSLFCLAYLIDESNNHLIMTDAEPISFIIKRLTMAVNSKLRKYLGYSAAELVDGLTQIAINDHNKKKIADCGAIPVIVTMLETAENDDERLLGAKCLWMLAFDESNQRLMTSNESFMVALYKLRASDNKEIQKAAAGALWEIEGRSKHAVNREAPRQSTSDPSCDKTSPDSCRHVMISYQWDVQDTMIVVKNKLQAAGFNVWMDLEQMGGSTLEAMAKAVEDSAVVLVCVSQKYKESPNCRSEAEYAFSLHKDIIPLMLEKRYRPAGWLGMIVGSKLWFEFSERHMMDTSLEKLIKELGRRGRLGEKVVKSVTEEEHVIKTVDSSKPDIRQWTKKEVSNWLNSIGLSNVSNKAREWLDGKRLIRLQDLRQECPEFFYNSVKKDLELAEVDQVLTFADELKKLVS